VHIKPTDLFTISYQITIRDRATDEICEILYALFPNSENSCSISLCGERHSFKLFVLRRPQCPRLFAIEG